MKSWAGTRLKYRMHGFDDGQVVRNLESRSKTGPDRLLGGGHQAEDRGIGHESKVGPGSPRAGWLFDSSSLACVEEPEPRESRHNTEFTRLA